MIHIFALSYSAQGKFTTVDPAVGVAEQPYSLHPYQYAYSAPTVWSDPSGRCVFTGVDTLVCAGIVITVYEAVVFLVAAGMATYATYDACITRGGCNRLAADLQRYFDSPTDIDTPPATTGNETEYVLMPEGNEEGPEGDPSSKLGAGAKLAAGVTAATIIGGTVLAPACPPAAQDDDKQYTHQVLVVGEHASSFVYSQGLAARHPDWKVVGSDYGNGSNSQIVLPSMRNLTIVRNVDATRLHSGSYTGSRFFDNIIFNAPRATTKRFYEDTGKL